MIKKMIFIQADCRYNQYLLKKINNKEVIKHTIDRIREIDNIERIVLSTYNCSENKVLKDMLDFEKDIILDYSDEEDLSRRFLQCVDKFKDIDIIIRVCGEQACLQSEIVNKDIEQFIINNSDFYFPNNNGLYCDIVSRTVLINNREIIKKYDRYYKGFLMKEIKCKSMDIERKDMFLNLYIQDETSFMNAKNIIENKITDVKKYCYDINRLIISKIYSKDSYFLKSGWIRSVLEEKIINEKGESIPWLSYNIIDFLEERINIDMNVFEYGSGNSTLWWQNRVKEIISVENDRKYYKLLIENPDYKNKQNLLYEDINDENKYELSIKRINKKFDIVVIDGRKRNKCSKIVPDCLKENGVIIWDNTDREYYQEGIDYLERCGYKKIVFKGIGPAYSFEYHTTIFYKINNCLGI